MFHTKKILRNMHDKRYTNAHKHARKCVKWRSNGCWKLHMRCAKSTLHIRRVSMMNVHALMDKMAGVEWVDQYIICQGWTRQPHQKNSLLWKCSAINLRLPDELCLAPMAMESASVSMDSVPSQPLRTRSPTENPVHGYPRLAHHVGHTRGSAIFRRFATLNVSVTSYSLDAIWWRTKSDRLPHADFQRQKICCTCRRRSVTWNGIWTTSRKQARIWIDHINTGYQCYEAQKQQSTQRCNGRRSWRLGISWKLTVSWPCKWEPPCSRLHYRWSLVRTRKAL